MKIVFLGTPDIAAACLQKIVEDGFDVAAVYTKPDMPKNRGMKLAMSDVKQYALTQDIPVLQPQSFRDPAVVEELRALAPDVIACVAYGKILPQSVLEIPPLGCINIHASVLPKLRGSGPVQWAILNGEEETGVTAMYMAPEMDAGDIIEIRRTSIDPAENAQQLLDRLARLGAQLLSDTMAQLRDGKPLPRQKQDNSMATYAPMLTKALCPIDWAKTRRQICDHVRGLDPWPVATMELAGKRFKVYKVEPSQAVTAAAPGTPVALTKRGLEIACGDGVLTVLTLQAEGGKRMAAPDYFRGHPITLPPQTGSDA